MKLSTKIYLVVLLFFFVSSVGLAYLYQKSRAEARRQTSNVENLVKAKNQELTLTREEYKHSETKWKVKIDSLLKAEKIALKKVKTITVVNIQYRDTGSVKLVYKEPIPKPDKSYSIPFATPLEDKCWGMAGQILTTDKNAKFQIDLRRANNSAELLVTRKRFLGFLWWKKGEKFSAYNDCGEIDFTKINFKK